MSEFQPSRRKSDLADVVEMLLDKGVVINADIAVSIGDTQLLGVQVRAAIASFETAAKYGLEFPEGTDMRRVAEAVDRPEIAEEERPRPPVDPTRGVNVTAVTEAADVERCLAVTESGERCSREAGEDGFCYQHDESDEIVSDPEELTREVRIEDGGGGEGGNEGGGLFGDDEGSLLGGDDGGLLGGDERGTERLGARPNPDVPETDAIDIGGDDGSNGDRDDADGGADGPNERGSAESNDDADEGGDA